MRETDTLQSYWLAGYYDDFNASRMVADEKNVPNYRTLDHTISHFGSILGGLNTMNPRYVYSYIDRTQTGLRNQDDPVREFTGTFIPESDEKLRANQGIHEWLTNDPLLGHDYEHRSRLRVPSSLVANRYRVNGASGDSYLRFVNGHDSQGQYYMPLGDMDPSWGGTQQLAYENHYSDGAFIGGYACAAQEDISARDVTVAHTNFASVYTGEKLAPVANPLTANHPDAYLHTITSPSKKQFLVNSLVNTGTSASSGSQRLLNYTGPLRLRGLGEMFHLRISSHQIRGSAVTYRLKIGYKGTTTYSEGSDDFADTTCLVNVTFKPTDAGVLASLDASTTAQPPFLAYDEDEIWADVYVYMDHTAGTWSLFFNNETTAHSTGSLGSVDYDTAKGWSLDAEWTAEPCAVDTLIDRAGVILPLNWKLDGTLPPIVTKMASSAGRNTISNMTIEVLDDDNEYSLSALVTASSATEWRLLAFRENESRPIWWGMVEQISHKQSAQNKTLSTTITARDSSGILDRLLPMWERGQGGTMSLSQHVSMDYTLEQRALTAKSLDDVLVFGSKPLKTFFSGLGFSYYDTSESGTVPYYHNDGYRMNLYSGTAVQMYLNEDTYGPNFAEEYWEGRGSDNLCLSTIIAEQPEVDGASGGRRSWFVEWDDPTDPTFASNANRATITTYLDISVGDTVSIEGTDYDGSYGVTALRAHKRSDGRFMAEIEVNDASASATLEMQFDVQRVDVLKIDGGYKYMELTTSTHSLEMGDTFILPAGCIDSTATANDTLKGVFLQVWDIRSSTKIVVRVPDTQEDVHLPLASSTALTFTGNKVGRAYPLTEVNSHDDKIEPVAKAHLFKGTTAPIASDTKLARTQYRDVHARWIRDFVRSPWFRAQFGVIAEEPLWRSGAGSHLQHPLSPQHIAAHGVGGHTSAGKANWTGLSADIAADATSITFENPAMWFKFKQSAQEHAIIELLDNETNDHQSIIATDISTPTQTATLEFDAVNERFVQTGSPRYALDEGDIVVHTGFSDDTLNGVFVLTGNSFTSGSTTIYYAVEVTGFEPAVDEFAYMHQRYQAGSAWNFGASRHFRDPDGIRAIRASDRAYENLTPLDGSSTDTGTLYVGSCVASGVKGLRRAYPKDSTIFSLRNVDESNGYKHMFVLWADMRNDGEANADGSERKNDFGLIIPTSDNYTVTVSFADQFDAQGNPDVFTELKVGADIDMWSMDSQVEPFTGGKWCALDGASNDEPFSRYHDWDEKAGAFVLIDASRFFNLNTAATGGRVGYNSGGLVDFGDYVLAVKGFPFLVDSYWRDAALSWRNNNHRTTTFAQHPNATYLANDHTTLAQTGTILVGDTTIYVDDNSLFDSNGGYGAIIGRVGEDRSAEDQLWYFAWTGKGTSATLGDFLSGVYITNIGRVADPATAEAVVSSEVAAGGVGSRSEISPKVVGVGDFEKVFVYNTTAAAFPLRLMVNVTGRVLSREAGTFYSNGKMRTLFSLMTSDTWAGNTSLPCMFNLSSVPVTRIMTTTQTSHVSGDTDSFGSMEDARGRSVLSIAGGISEKDGNGLSGGSKRFSWLMGRDNMFSVRPTYSTAQSLDRNNLMISDMTTQLASQVTNVRVFFNGNSQFADFPEPTLGQSTRWRTLNFPNISSFDEALALAKQEYAREQETRIDLKAQVLRRATDKHGMFTGARYGYIGDVFRRFYTTNIDSLSSWSNLWGGFPFSGVQYLHDKATTTHDSINALLLSQRAVRILPALVDPKPRGLTAHTADGGTYGSGKGKLRVSGAGGAVFVEFDAENNGASYGPSTALTAGWNTVSDGSTQLSLYATPTFISTPAIDTYQLEYAAFFERNNAQHHYGTNSLHYAAQIVHVDRDMPKSSETSNNELRVAVSIDSGSSADGAVFRLWLLDYSFDEAPTPGCPTLAATLEGSSSTLVFGSGYYRMAVPSSYDATERSVVVSVDAEYLRSIVRKTAGAVLNGHNIDGLSTYSSFNLNSAFPLGMRNQTRMGPRAHTRTAYYAPRLMVVDDLAFVPGTKITFNDDFVDMTTQEMIIENVTWSQDARDIEKVMLNLQRSESHYAYTLARALRNQTRGRSGGSPDSGARPELPPPSPSPQPNPGPGSPTGPVPINPTPDLGSGFDVSNGRVGANMFSVMLANTIKGRGSFSADSLGSQGTWGIIGQRKPGTALAANRDVDGVDSSVASTEGAAIQTSDGITLAGITDPELGAQGETNSYATNIRVPSDVSEMASITVTGTVSLESVSGGGDAVVTTTVTCIETGATFSVDSTIAQGSNREAVMLVRFAMLDGANTPGNTIKAEVTRSPGQGSDSADYQAVTIHTLSVSLRRFSLPTTDSQSNRFASY